MAGDGRINIELSTGEQPMTVDGHRLTLVTEGPDRLEALIALIEGARSSLRVLFYLFAADRSGTRVRDALVAAARRGIKVQLLTDRFGCSDVGPDFTQPLIDAGGSVCQFHPSWGRRYLLRNHQKFAIADAEETAPTGIVGGSNVSNHYFGTIKDNAWRDIWLIVEGPAMHRLGRYFDAVMGWAKRKGTKIRELRRIIRGFSETKGKLQWQFGGPMRRLSPWTTAITREISGAKRIDIIAAYFSPPRGLLKRIAATGRRGQARIITAAKSDNNATIAAARHTYRRLLRAGVELFEYLPSKLHTKLLIADDVTHVGSSNFDFRSLYLNMEIMLRIDDAAFAERMRRHFDSELKNCQQITKAIHRQRSSMWNRYTWQVSHFLVTSMDYTVTRRLNFGGER